MGHFCNQYIVWITIVYFTRDMYKIKCVYTDVSVCPEIHTHLLVLKFHKLRKGNTCGRCSNVSIDRSKLYTFDTSHQMVSSQCMVVWTNKSGIHKCSYKACRDASRDACVTVTVLSTLGWTSLISTQTPTYHLCSMCRCIPEHNCRCSH